MENEEKWKGRSALVPPKWIDEECDALVDAARILERECRACPGACAYVDNGGTAVTMQLDKNKHLEGRQVGDVAPGTDEAECFHQLVNQVGGAGSADVADGAAWTPASSKGRGKGKGALATKSDT